MGALELATFLYENCDKESIKLAGAAAILYHVYLEGDGLVPYDSGAFSKGIGISDNQRCAFPAYNPNEMKDGVEENGIIPLFEKIRVDLKTIAELANKDFNSDGSPDVSCRTETLGYNTVSYYGGPRGMTFWGGAQLEGTRLTGSAWKIVGGN